MYLDPPSWDRGTSASDYILKALNTIITAINTANNIILIQGKCILVVESALYGMFCVCNLRNQYVIGRTNKNKLPFLNSQHTRMLLWFCKLFNIIDTFNPKSSAPRIQARETRWLKKSFGILKELFRCRPLLWQNSDQKVKKTKKQKWYFSCSNYIIFYSTIDRYMRCVSYLWQHMRVVSVMYTGHTSLELI